MCGFQQRKQQKLNGKSTKVEAHTHRYNKQRDEPNAILYRSIHFQLLLAHQINITFSDVDETNRRRLSINCVKTKTKKRRTKNEITNMKNRIENAQGNGKTTWALKWIYSSHKHQVNQESNQMQTQTVTNAVRVSKRDRETE